MSEFLDFMRQDPNYPDLMCVILQQGYRTPQDIDISRPILSPASWV